MWLELRDADNREILVNMNRIIKITQHSAEKATTMHGTDGESIYVSHALPELKTMIDAAQKRLG
jgi:hypothetical protein